MESFRKSVGVETLKNLRQVSSTFNQSLSQVYLDKLEKSITFTLRDPHPQPNWTISEPVPDGGAYIFRELIFEPELTENTELDMLNDEAVIGILRSISPHLHKIKFGPMLDNHFRNCVSILHQVASLIPLTNLTDLEVEQSVILMSGEADYISKFREFLHILPPTVNVTMSITGRSMLKICKVYPEIIFPSRVVEIKVDRFLCTTEMEMNEILNHRSQMAGWNKTNHISFSPKGGSFVPEPNGFDFTNNCPRILESIQELMLTFDDGLIVMLNLMFLNDSTRKKIDLLSWTPKINIWGQNITTLRLDYYCNTVCVECLPNLTHFALAHCDVNSCILSNDSSTDQEILAQRFDKKQYLAVCLYGTCYNSRIQPGNQLALSLKELVKILLFPS